MESKAYKLIIEMVCPGCAREKCFEHISSKIVTDPKSGLEGEAVCVCKNCNPNN